MKEGVIAPASPENQRIAMNKNYREWASSGSDSAFQNKLDRVRDLHDLEVLTARYTRLPFTNPPVAQEPRFKPSELQAPGMATVVMSESQEDSSFPIDKESQLYNRSHFDETLEYETNRALRYHRHLSVCVVRLEELDMMRGSLNSQELSRLTFRLARAFKDILRGIDIPVRFDEKTFAVILPETNSAGATAVAERIRNVFKEMLSNGKELAAQKAAPRPSLGCACFPSHAKTASGLIDSALRSLEAAASRGGDMVCML